MFGRFAAMGDEELYEVLTAIKGIGGSSYSVTSCRAGSKISCHLPKHCNGVCQFLP